MIWFWGLFAFSEDNLPELWAQLHEGQLVHLVDGAPQEAIEIFEALLKGLSPSHPLFGELLFSLGRAQYDSGALDLAKKSLLSSLETTKPPHGALEYYIHLLAEDTIIAKYPYSGNPWKDTTERRGDYIVFRLGGAAQNCAFIHIDIAPQEDLILSVSVYSQKGVRDTKTYSLNLGKHRISLSKLMFPKEIQKEGVFLVELRSENQKSIGPVFLDIP